MGRTSRTPGTGQEDLFSLIAPDDKQWMPYHHNDEIQSALRRAERDRRSTEKRIRETAETIMSRPFIAWDGEGWNEGGRHQYKFLANSVGQLIVAEPGRSLDAAQVFRMFMETRDQYPDAFHVMYGASYDFNCILRGNGLPRSAAFVLHKSGYGFVDGYAIRYMPGRMLRVQETIFVRDNPNPHSFILYDVIPFFQRSFVAAMDEYFPEGWESSELIRMMKARRGTFTVENLDEEIEYNRLELVNLVRLMNELRQRLYDAGVLVSRWYGPGAIASVVLKRQRIKEAMDQSYPETNPELAQAAREAYAGGRFELIKTGYSNKPVYEYDINSAYPYAMTFLPNLQRGKWQFYDHDPGYHPFALYHIKFQAPMGFDEHMVPQPLFRRHYNSAITYPCQVKGWFWTPETRVAQEWVRIQREKGIECNIIIDKAWVFHEDNPNDKPFAFLHEMFRQRQVLKKNGSGAHVGLKLAMNSMYGKMAQQIGYDAKRGKLPPFHQLEWAGYVTSHCRASVLRAVLPCLESVVAFETDAVFVEQKLHGINEGTNLGEWEYTEFSDMLYIQSGVHWGTVVKQGSTEIEPRTRGIADRILDPELVKRTLLEPGGWNKLTIPSSHFITLGLALQFGYHRWGNWEQQNKTLKMMLFDGSSKRSHVDPQDCPECENYNYMEEPDAIPRPTLGNFHPTWVADFSPRIIENAEHKVTWIHDDSVTKFVDEQRQMLLDDVVDLGEMEF